MNCPLAILRYRTPTDLTGIFPPPATPRMKSAAMINSPSPTMPLKFSSQLDGIEGLGPKRRIYEIFQILTKSRKPAWVRLLLVYQELWQKQFIITESRSRPAALK